MKCSLDVWSLVSGHLALLCNGLDPTLEADLNVCLLMAVTQIPSTCVLVSHRFLTSEPLLFTIYASKLFEVKKTIFRKYMLMQMTHSYICHLALTHILVSGCYLCCSDCINYIRTWMTVDKMKLKGDKTEFIVIGIREATTTHINKPCQPALYHLHNIRRIRKFVSMTLLSPWYRL